MKNKKGKSKQGNATTKRKFVLILAIQNILFAIVDKIIVSQYHAYGAPLFVTIILWIGILRKWRYSQGVYIALAIIEVFAGIFTLICSILYIAKGYDPTAPIMQTVLGCSYAASIFALYKLRGKP